MRTGRYQQLQEDLSRRSTMTCPHHPPCPLADAVDREAARTVARHAQQGWSLLCNGVVLFEDNGELLPNGVVVGPRRPSDRLVGVGGPA
jgi:hypothetical protein